MPYLHRAGAQVWFDVVGAGPPLLVLPGLGDAAASAWRITPRLAERHTTILVDHRGAGRSDVPALPLTLRTLADDAAAVLDAVEAGPAHVVGFSMGGLVAQELALTHAAAARSLVLGCTSPGGRDAVPGTFAWRDPSRWYADTTAPAAIAADLHARGRHPATRRGVAAQLAAVAGYRGAGARLHRWHGPTLIAHGTTDRIVPVENARRLARRIPHAELCLLAGAGHVITTDATDRLVAAILAFTARVDAPAACTAEGCR
ncbi:alpha/beta fold hydrolase [Nocardioides sp. WV_118_6]